MSPSALPAGRHRAWIVPAVCDRRPAQAGEGEETGQAEDPGHQTRWVQASGILQDCPFPWGFGSKELCPFVTPDFFPVLCFSHPGIYTSYKTFLHKDKTLIKRLLKVGNSHSVLGGKTVPRAQFEQTELPRGAELSLG